MAQLGFGYLRLPGADYKTGVGIDYPLLNQMVDRFLALGGRYFDTAQPYLGGHSQEAIRRSLTQRYDRAAFHLANKLTAWVAKQPQDLEPFFQSQLQHCGVDYFDTYLLHGLDEEYYAQALRDGHFDFLRAKKEAGLARRIGFSYHGDPKLLDRILKVHPEVDLVQLQINYLDWDSRGIQSRRCYEVARSHGKPIVVMEPVKGGTLMKLPEKVLALLHEATPGRSPAAWALGFVRSLEGVETILSGMNTLAQIEENLAPAELLTEDDIWTLTKAAALLRSEKTIGCTSCGYCLTRCPKNIPIPKYFGLYNEYTSHPGDLWRMGTSYLRLAAEQGSASDCIACGACTQRCPQNLPIPTHMKEVAKVFEQA